MSKKLEAAMRRAKRLENKRARMKDHRYVKMAEWACFDAVALDDAIDKALDRVAEIEEREHVAELFGEGGT